MSIALKSGSFFSILDKIYLLYHAVFFIFTARSHGRGKVSQGTLSSIRLVVYTHGFRKSVTARTIVKLPPNEHLLFYSYDLSTISFHSTPYHPKHFLPSHSTPSLVNLCPVPGPVLPRLQPRIQNPIMLDPDSWDTTMVNNKDTSDLPEISDEYLAHLSTMCNKPCGPHPTNQRQLRDLKVKTIHHDVANDSASHPTQVSYGTPMRTPTRVQPKSAWDTGPDPRNSAASSLNWSPSKTNPLIKTPNKTSISIKSSHSRKCTNIPSSFHLQTAADNTVTFINTPPSQPAIPEQQSKREVLIIQVKINLGRKVSQPVEIYRKFVLLLGRMFATRKIELVKFDSEDSQIYEGPAIPKMEEAFVQ